MNKFCSFPDVAARYRTSRSSIYRWLKDADLNFPQPVKIGHRTLWRASDLDAFDERIAGETSN